MYPPSTGNATPFMYAESFEASGFSEVIREDALDPSMLIETVMKVYNNREKYIAAMSERMELNPIEKIVNILEEVKKEKLWTTFMYPDREAMFRQVMPQNIPWGAGCLLRI